MPLSVFAAVFTTKIAAFTYKGYNIPAYDGDLYEVINNNVPTFDSSELTQNIYERYGALDSLGRVTACTANIDKSLMPAQERGNISSVYPTGWAQKSYSFVEGGWLYNRSHLIGFQLTGENANKKNLMTGTRSFNAYGMLPFEKEVADYVRVNDENNVLYRVTPVFGGDNLLAYGVIMEAESVDDLGASVSFCVFVYNVQSGVGIDYKTGLNVASGEKLDISGAYIQLSKTKYVYSGKACRPAVTLKVSHAKIPADYYTLKYTNNTAIGTATVTVTGKGACKGTKKYTFRIIPKSTSISSLTGGKKQITVKWRRQTVQTNGYQIQYSTSSKFNSAKAVLIKNNKTASRKISSLQSGKNYFIRIRTYKTVKGKRVYSNWSKQKAIKTK